MKRFTAPPGRFPHVTINVGTQLCPNVKIFGPTAGLSLTPLLICVSVHGSAEVAAASAASSFKPVYLGGVMKSLRESDAAGVNSRQ